MQSIRVVGSFRLMHFMQMASKDPGVGEGVAAQSARNCHDTIVN